MKLFVFWIVIVDGYTVTRATVSAPTFQDAVELALWQNGYEVSSCQWLCRPVADVCVFTAKISKNSIQYSIVINATQEGHDGIANV